MEHTLTTSLEPAATSLITAQTTLLEVTTILTIQIRKVFKMRTVRGFPILLEWDQQQGDQESAGLAMDLEEVNVEVKVVKFKDRRF